MRLAGSFCFREILDEIVAIPTGEGLQKFSGIISVNQTGRFLMEALAREQTEQSLAEALLQEFDSDPQTAARDIREFLQLLRENDLLIED